MASWPTDSRAASPIARIEVRYDGDDQEKGGDGGDGNEHVRPKFGKYGEDWLNSDFQGRCFGNLVFASYVDAQGNAGQILNACKSLLVNLSYLFKY